MAALLSIEVWRDSGESTLVEFFQGTLRTDRVEVIPGDCLDVEIDDGMTLRLSGRAID